MECGDSIIVYTVFCWRPQSPVDSVLGINTVGLSIILAVLVGGLINPTSRQRMLKIAVTSATILIGSELLHLIRLVTSLI